MILKINGVDYTDNVIVGTHNVNQKEIFSEWEDANYKIHRSNYHTKIGGTVDLIFKSTEDYEAFCDVIQFGKLEDGRCRMMVSVNNVNAVFDGYAYVKFEPIRAMNTYVGDFYNQFTLEIEEA